ncbi:MAG: Ribosomal RNA small subunit methyltransferase I [Parcubacteria group bacterium GW2011_GWB1_45_7]|nr:MAG: Ribosomal RNA small subunit methyltransferase I [Parcubacteria group bacterium GW2011_GWB1_45_7]
MANNLGMLYIVATPIGNLGDISLRALEILKTVDTIFCEDTRQTLKLLDYYEIATKTYPFKRDSDYGAIDRIAEMLFQKDSVAIVSDAGTPGINDPGARLISELVSRMPQLCIVPIPGANAAISALSVSGFPSERWSYWGFIPNKKGRQTYFKKIAENKDVVICYESKYRIIKTLQELKDALAVMEQSDRQIMIARELTKLHETIYRGTVAQVRAMLGEDEVLGEFVLIVGPNR